MIRFFMKKRILVIKGSLNLWVRFILLLGIMSVMMIQCKSLTPKQKLYQARDQYLQGKKEQLETIRSFTEEKKNIPQEQAGADKQLRREAVAVLANLPANGKIWPILVSLTKDKELAPLAFEALQKRQPSEALQPLIKLHGEQPTDIFIITLGYLRNENAISYLKTFILKNPLQESIGINALLSLDRLGSERARRVIAEVALSRQVPSILRAKAVSLLDWRDQGFVQKTWRTLIQETDQELLLRKQVQDSLLRKKNTIQAGEKIILDFLIGWYRKYQKDNKADLDQSYMTYLVQLYAGLADVSEKTARKRMAGARPRIVRKNYVPVLSRNQWMAQINRSARLQGITWNASKGKEVLARAQSGIAKAALDSGVRFQQVYKILSRYYPQKTYHDLKRFFRDTKNTDLVLSIIVRDAVKRYKMKNYAVYYLSSLLEISRQDASLLLHKYY